MPWILEHPGCSAWELSKESNIGYSQVSKALIKLRDLELVRADPEEREAGGFRYRYYPLGDHGEQEARLRRLAHAQDRTTAI
jgi:predicted transcriptional regulator